VVGMKVRCGLTAGVLPLGLECFPLVILKVMDLP